MKVLFYGFRHSHIYGIYKELLDSAETEILACVEENAAAREAATAALGISFDDCSYDEWLNCSELEAVVLGGCYGDRGKAAIKALEKGKHVVADKPLCTSLSELSKIRKLSKKKGLKVQCVFELRYLPAVIKAKEVLDDGRLGRVKNISFTGQHCLNYGTRPSWYFEDGKHGGTLNDLAIHGIDLVKHLTGLTIEKVNAARVWNNYAAAEPKFLDSAMFMATLTGGVGLIADTSYSAPSQVFSMPTYWDFKIWCERGLLTFNYTDGAVRLYEEGVEGVTRLEGTSLTRTAYTDFLDEVRSGSRAITESVLSSTETALKLQACAKEK